ncbi:MAG: hypothetical protein RQ966_07045 [Acetobacteraceae bacterium]|nr:hypothetical protein [Acetobacteraceae bacterium]
MAKLSDADGRHFRADAGAIVEGTLRNFPLQVAQHMLLNTARQFVSIESGTEMDPYWWAHFTQPAFLVHDVQGTLQQSGELDPLLSGLNVLDAVFALASGIACVVLFFRLRDPNIRALIATVALTLLANAFASGALGGVFGRYQGRVIWLLPTAAMIAVLALRRSPR